MKGVKTNHFTDVKMPVKAGMPFFGGDYKIKRIGYDVYRHYYDNNNKDLQVGSERIKRVLTS